MRSRIALLVLLTLPLAPLGAQLVPYPFEEEAAETIFDFDAGDAEVSLFASGTWDVNVAPGIGWVVSRRADGSRRALPGYEFPGLESVLFDQTPRLTLSLWLLQRYFFETTVSEEVSESTILFGYAGREGESVQSVLVGNTAIGIGAYPYLGFGDETGSVGQDAPGASALFQTPVSEHELMVRFAPAEDADLLYANGGVVSETRVAAGDYERGRHFVLPDGGLDFLEVYVASADGAFTDQDGTRYRRVDLDRETVYSLADGTVSFREPPQTAVLVYYEAGGLPIGDPSLGRQSWFGLTGDGHPSPTPAQNFSFDPGELGAYADEFGDGSELDADDFRRTLNGPGADRTAFLLHQPGRYAPFATAASYALPETGTSAVTLEYPNGTPYPASLRLVRIENRSLLTIAAGDDPRAFANRYPLASDAAAAPIASIYGPGAVDAVNAPQVVFRSVRETDTIVLPSGFIPGSVRITRNGTTETRFVVEDSGRVVFDSPLRRTDVVRIAYRTSAAAGAGDLLFASGNTFAVAPGTAATIALGARWKPVGAAYSTRPGEYPGRLSLSGSLETDSREWREERPYELAAGLEAAVSFASPDTSGVLRLASMNEGGRSIAISPTGLFLAPTPVGLDAGERGFLRHADYFTTNAFGERSLLAYDDPAAPAVDPYEAGSRGGPFPAASYDSGRSGTVAVFDYEIPDDRSWVAGLIRVDGGAGTDLSDVRTIVVPYRVLDASGEAVQLRLEIGAVAEDLDGDGTLDTGTNGLGFFDEANGVTLTTGAAPPPGFRYTEDANGNGVLDPELPDLVFSAEIAPAITDAGSWVFEPINVTAAEARRLARTRAVRVVIERTPAGTASGRILVGEIDVLGAAFATTVTGVDA